MTRTARPPDRQEGPMSEDDDFLFAELLETEPPDDVWDSLISATLASTPGAADPASVPATEREGSDLWETVIDTINEVLENLDGDDEDDGRDDADSPENDVDAFDMSAFDDHSTRDHDPAAGEEFTDPWSHDSADS